MLKLLNRFAWLIAIVIAIAIFAIDDDFFIFGIIAGLVVKFVFLSESFIKDRLEFFAESIKENYISENIKQGYPQGVSLQDKNSSDTLYWYQEDNNQEEIVNLEEIEEKSEINNDFNQTNLLSSSDELEQKEKTIDLENSIKYTKFSNEPTAFDIFADKVMNYIKDFFSTNLLAKLGGILVFLAVVYFLKGFVGDLWEIIGPKGRIAFGIFTGFTTYFAGAKIHGKYPNEGLILMGTGILINFAVILSGRYLVGGDDNLSEGITFIFLILNTIFGVLTSMIYKSKTLLIFSFIFAYLNPFIILAESNGEPYTLVGYSFIVSLGALFIAKKETNLTLIILSFIFGNLLFLVAPFSDSIGWSAKMILISIFSIITIILITRFKGLKLSVNKQILWIFNGTYLFIILNLLNSTTNHSGLLQVMGNALSSNLGFIVYNVILLGLFGFTIKLLNNLKNGENKLNLGFVLFIPLLILLAILFSGNLIYTPFVLIFTLIVYLIGFSLVGNISNIFSYIFFGILSIFILFFNLDLIFGIEELTKTQFVTMIISSLVFLFSSYYYSFKKTLVGLFSLGTIGTVLILAPIIQNSGNLMILSIIAIIIFAVANLVLPLINSKLLKKENLNILIAGSLVGALFFAFQIYSFGEIHFPGVAEGFVFLGLAIIYFMQGYFVANKLGFENMKKDTHLQNTFYSFIAISISLFSVAIAFVFSNYPEIITTTWLFEATILYFFYGKNGNQKIFWAATILFIIGLTKFGILTTLVESKDYGFLISFTVILASFMLNLFFINNTPLPVSPLTGERSNMEGIHNIHHILHIIGMGIMGVLLLQIIPSTGHGWSLFGISIFITVLGYFYAKFDFRFLKIVFLFVIGAFGLLHIGELNMVFWKLQKDELEYLKILQYIVTAIIISNIFIWRPHLASPERRGIKKVLLIIISLYGFIISNLYILDLFKDIFGDFTLTIYWGLIASALLIYGIQKDLIKYRTIGLYFLSLTTLKIFLMDVWQIGDTNSRIAVFAILGVIFIIISTLYTKRFGDNLLGEFSLNNLKDEEENIKENNYNSPIIPFHKGDENIQEVEEDNIFLKKLKKVDVENIKVIRFFPNGGEKFNVRATNLKKIVKIITKKTGQTSFKPNELDKIYDYVIKNYKSDLSRREYDKIRSEIKYFIEVGGKIEIIKK